jgi:hypothetical protein
MKGLYGKTIIKKKKKGTGKKRTLLDKEGGLQRKPQGIKW